MTFLTLDDIDVRGKTVLVRVDINCPIHKDSKRIMDDTRIRIHTNSTIRELRDKGAKTVVLSHQGRPEDTDFVSLEEHAKIMAKHLDAPVQFVYDFFGSSARDAIKRMKSGDVLLLENVRFNSEEMLERPADAQAKTFMVRKLAPVADFFVNDAFGAIHRSQPSLVGFGEVLPTVAGRVIETELRALGKVFDHAERPAVFVLGGVKVPESLKVMKAALANGNASLVLTGGLLGNLFLLAKGYSLGEASVEILRGKGIEKFLPPAQELLRDHEGRIEMPVDVAVENGSRMEISVADLPTPYPIADIGRETVGRYCKILEDAKIIVINSPMGKFEKPEYSYGTSSIINKAAKLNGYRVIGGGHSAEMVHQLKMAGHFDHVSSGGRAALYYLAGEKTPVVTMLQKAKQRMMK